MNKTKIYTRSLMDDLQFTLYTHDRQQQKRKRNTRNSWIQILKF